MSGILLTLLIIAIMPFLAKLPLVWAMHRAGGYDNHYPRRQQSQLSGFGQRCTAAHYNSFEALAFYSVAIILVVASGQVSSLMLNLGWLFIALRVVYLLCYWLDWATARSLIWLASMASAISLMLLALGNV
jgi:uncharacterized MAPEG superfamily protein